MNQAPVIQTQQIEIDACWKTKGIDWRPQLPKTGAPYALPQPAKFTLRLHPDYVTSFMSRIRTNRAVLSAEIPDIRQSNKHNAT